jgi:hypothetical protein
LGGGLVLPLYYVLDATWTLLARLARGEKVWHAHREHWYQRAAAATRHDAVSLGSPPPTSRWSRSRPRASRSRPPGPLAGPVVLALILELTRMARAEKAALTCVPQLA